MAEQREKSPGGLTEALPTDALKEAGQHLLGLLVQRATEAATQRVSGLADRLGDVTTNGGDVRAAMNRGRTRDDDPDSEDRDRNGGPGVLAKAWSGVTEKVKETFGGSSGGGGGAKKLKMTNIVEGLDIGLPLRTTYDLWTQFEDFPSFMKKVETVEQAADEKTNWTAKVFWSRRTWEATIVEQVPDSHIIWRSTGAKGHVDGAVSFTELGPNLTRVLLVLEYWPKGLFERTGNLWRAQGRRARLEFKHFRRHAMTSVILHQDEIEGWRGEIRDSEVVKTHEDALAQEEAQAEEPSRDESAAGDEAAEDELGPDDAAEEVADDEDVDDAGDLEDADELEEADDLEDSDDLEDEDATAVEDDEFYDDEEYADDAADAVPARSGSRG
jgi:Polyketide cyclase / dehydrase and lipid transport